MKNVTNLYVLDKEDSGPIKVNQKMAFFVFEMDFFRVFNISLGQNTSFEKLGLKPSFAAEK